MSTESFTIRFEAGADGRLYQRAVGATDADGKLQRTDEGYPQGGDGYIWEPALQIVHADGNTSTSLICDNVTRTNDEAGRELTRIQLHDPAYPVTVALNF
ncbi:MAG TPA: glycoside hydrolase family 36 N-terminal domain-containing protein, partial [Verrucomicrobiae bacterium]|nr:glycoside hydrolase family 36 N-terminal domain-containing protein [Verrucomicrobiae bacterium]